MVCARYVEFVRNWVTTENEALNFLSQHHLLKWFNRILQWHQHLHKVRWMVHRLLEQHNKQLNLPMDHNQHQFKLHKLLKHQYHLNQFLFSLPQTQDEAHPPW